MSRDSIVLLSGGQDSTTCLAWAKANLGVGVRTVAFDYGQKHRVELEQCEKIAEAVGVISHTVLEVPALRQIGGAALTDDSVSVAAIADAGSGNEYARTHGLPSTFVPGRNMLFLTLAVAYGARFGVYDVVTGVCQADDAGYPDCRASFVRNAELALMSALDEPQVRIHAPLIHLSKAHTFEMADNLGILDLVLEETHTCYNGDRSKRHSWGYGCGTCPACNEREKGWNGYNALLEEARS